MARSLLGKAAELCAASGEPVLVPWYRDDANLLAAVMARAQGNSLYASQVVDAVLALVENDKRLRGKLRKALSPGKALKTGRARSPLWQGMQIVTSLDALYSQGIPKMKAGERVGEILNLSAKRIEALESLTRKHRCP